MPRRRPLRVFPERVASAIESMTPGTLGGRVSSAAPVVSTDVAATIGGDAGVTDLASGAVGWTDEFDIASDGEQTVDLTYLPISDRGIHVELNGLQQRRDVDWSRADQELTLLAAMDVRTGDSVDVHYAFRFGAPVVPSDEPVAEGEAFVQVSPANHANASSVTATFPAGITSGNALVAMWVGQFTRTVTAMSGCGATWTRAVRVPGTAFDLSCEIWIGTGATSGTTVTATTSSSAELTMMVGELASDFAGTVRTTSSAGPTTSNAPVIPSITPVLGELVLGLTACDTITFTYTTVTDSPGAWTDLTDKNDGNMKVRWGYRVALSTSAHQRQYAADGSLEWVGATVVIT